jgi:cyclohexa-1,5-dienecarbonyl-CoA hydratase
VSPQKIRVEWTHGGRVARLVLAAPKANILDRTMISELTRALEECGASTPHAIVISAEGPHFSFGASVEEHLPEQIEETLTALHRLLRRLVGAPAPTVAAVQGQCLGGGLELVLGCDLVLAEESARFSLPEIKLGVFPPAASALLPVRVGAAKAASLTITGTGLTAQEGSACGMVTRIATAGHLEEELHALLDSDFLSRPAIALRCAAEAVRWPARVALYTQLPAIERLYLEKLMASADASEGIRAFLEKREPKWELQLH